MRLEIKSVYENIDQDWLNWWVDRMKKEAPMPGVDVIVDELIETGDAVFASKDPTSPSIATTYYKLDRNPQPSEPEKESSQ